MSCRYVHVSIAFCVALMLYATACSGGEGNHAQAPPTQENETGLQLPAPIQIPRSTCTAIEGAKADGADFLKGAGLSQHAEGLGEGSLAQLSPDYSMVGSALFSDAAYCMYHFHIPGYHDTAAINYDFDAAPPQWELVWIGAANWQRGTWDWFCGEELNHIELDSITPYINSGDELLLAVVVLGTQQALLDYVQFGDNIEPMPVLIADPTSGEAPLTVHLDGSSSYDNGGSITLYEWDTTGDGTFEQSGESLSTLDYEYTAAGSYSATLRVTDDHGAAATTTVPISVTAEPSGAWHLVTADGGNEETGWYADLEEVAGFPAIAYLDHENTSTPGEIRYIRALDAQGSAWGTPLILGVCGEYGGHLSMITVDGRPAIAYADGTNSAIKYIRASNADGSAWDSAVQAAADPWERPGMVSMCLVEGNPAIAYIDSYDDLYYVRATDALGAGWPATPLLLDDDTGSSWDIGSMLVAGGVPVVFYSAEQLKDVRMVRATNAAGSSWNTPETVIDSGTLGVYHSETLVSGNPALAYFDSSTHDVYYQRANNAQCSSWGTPVKINVVIANMRRDLSLAVISGKPAVSYYDQENGKLVYSLAQDALGTAWDTPQVVDNHWYDTTGWYSSLKYIAGQPCIGYYNWTQGALQFAAMY